MFHRAASEVGTANAGRPPNRSARTASESMPNPIWSRQTGEEAAVQLIEGQAPGHVGQRIEEQPRPIGLGHPQVVRRASPT